jgi:4-amino-4-deoxy-L-arabinose transferase-like glycosyltransferase
MSAIDSPQEQRSESELGGLLTGRSTGAGPSVSESRATRFLPPILFASALALAAWTVLASLPDAPQALDADPGFYLHYMRRIRADGLSAFPALFDEWNTDMDSWICPPPSRIGYIVVSALWGAVFGTNAVVLQYLSIAAYLANAIVNYLFARRHFGEPAAVCIGVLWTFSPLMMGLSRLALTDSFIALCMCLTTWLFLEVVDRPESRARRILFMAALGFTVLTKELSALLVIPYATFVLIERFWRREPMNLVKFALTFAIPGIVILPIFVVAAGGASPLLQTTRIVLESPSTNRYAILLGSGPWFRYLIDFFCLSPITMLLGIGGFSLFVTRLRAGEYDRRLMLMATIAVCLLFAFSFFTKNVRYAVLLELPIRIFAAWVLIEMVKAKSAVRSAVLCGVAIALLCWLDWRMFEVYWVDGRGYDPVTQALLRARHIVPVRPP